MTDKKIKAVLWDMDGTLCNTKPGIEKAVQEALVLRGLPPVPDNRIDEFIGPPIQLSFRDVCGLPEEEAVKTADTFREIYRTKGYVELSDPYPGLLSTLRKLHDEGYLLAVCTLKKQDMAERIVRKYGMGELFGSIVGTDARDNIKKHDTINMTTRKFGIDNKEAVLIGDTDFDSLGAEKAGCLFIGVTYGFGFVNRKEVDAYPNIGTAEKAEDVYDLVSAYNNSTE